MLPEQRLDLPRHAVHIRRLPVQQRAQIQIIAPYRRLPSLVVSLEIIRNPDRFLPLLIDNEHLRLHQRIQLLIRAKLRQTVQKLHRTVRPDPGHDPFQAIIHIQPQQADARLLHLAMRGTKRPVLLLCAGRAHGKGERLPGQLQ